MATSGSRSLTLRLKPGRKEARTRQQRSPRRRSRLAGWIWLSAKGWSAAIDPSAIKVSIAWQGRMPEFLSSLIAGDTRRATRVWQARCERALDLTGGGAFHAALFQVE